MNRLRVEGQDFGLFVTMPAGEMKAVGYSAEEPSQILS